MTKVFRVGYVGEDRVVIADSAEQAIANANAQASAERAELLRRHGNARPAARYSVARELVMVGGVESRLDEPPVDPSIALENIRWATRE